MDALDGITEIETRAGAKTVNRLEPAMPAAVAVMLVDPWLTLVANPPLILATAGDEDAHFTAPVMFFVVPFEYVPVAVNCRASPSATEAGLGVTAIETKEAATPVPLSVTV